MSNPNKAGPEPAESPASRSDPKGECRKAIEQLHVNLDGLGDEELADFAESLQDELKGRKAQERQAEGDVGSADESEARPSLKPYNANDPEAVAEHNNMVGRAVRLMILDHSGRWAASVCESADEEFAKFNEAMAKRPPYEPPDSEPQTVAEFIERLRDMDRRRWCYSDGEDQDVALIVKGIEAMTPEQQAAFMQGHRVLVLESADLDEQEVAKWRKDTDGRVFANFDAVEIGISALGFGGGGSYVYNQTLIGHHGTFEQVHAAIRRAVEKLNDPDDAEPSERKAVWQQLMDKLAECNTSELAALTKSIGENPPPSMQNDADAESDDTETVHSTDSAGMELSHHAHHRAATLLIQDDTDQMHEVAVVAGGLDVVDECRAALTEVGVRLNRRYVESLEAAETNGKPAKPSTSLTTQLTWIRDRLLKSETTAAMDPRQTLSEIRSAIDQLCELATAEAVGAET